MVMLEGTPLEPGDVVYAPRIPSPFVVIATREAFGETWADCHPEGSTTGFTFRVSKLKRTK